MSDNRCHPQLSFRVEISFAFCSSHLRQRKKQGTFPLGQMPVPCFEDEASNFSLLSGERPTVRPEISTVLKRTNKNKTKS